MKKLPVFEPAVAVAPPASFGHAALHAALREWAAHALPGERRQEAATQILGRPFAHGAVDIGPCNLHPESLMELQRICMACGADMLPWMEDPAWTRMHAPARQPAKPIPSVRQGRLVQSMKAAKEGPAHRTTPSPSPSPFDLYLEFSDRTDDMPRPAHISEWKQALQDYQVQLMDFRQRGEQLPREITLRDRVYMPCIAASLNAKYPDLRLRCFDDAAGFVRYLCQPAGANVPESERAVVSVDGHVTAFSLFRIEHAGRIVRAAVGADSAHAEISISQLWREARKAQLAAHAPQVRFALIDLRIQKSPTGCGAFAPFIAVRMAKQEEPWFELARKMVAGPVNNNPPMERIFPADYGIDDDDGKEEDFPIFFHVEDTDAPDIGISDEYYKQDQSTGHLRQVLGPAWRERSVSTKGGHSISLGDYIDSRKRIQRVRQSGEGERSYHAGIDLKRQRYIQGALEWLSSLRQNHSEADAEAIAREAMKRAAWTA